MGVDRLDEVPSWFLQGLLGLLVVIQTLLAVLCGLTMLHVLMLTGVNLLRNLPQIEDHGWVTAVLNKLIALRRHERGHQLAALHVHR